MHIPVAKIILSGIHIDICAFAWVSKYLPRNPQELLCRGDYRHDLHGDIFYCIPSVLF